LLPPSSVIVELSKDPPIEMPMYDVLEMVEALSRRMDSKLTVLPRLASPADVKTAPFNVNEPPVDAPPTLKAKSDEDNVQLVITATDVVMCVPVTSRMGPSAKISELDVTSTELDVIESNFSDCAVPDPSEVRRDWAAIVRPRDVVALVPLIFPEYAFHDEAAVMSTIKEDDVENCKFVPAVAFTVLAPKKEIATEDKALKLKLLLVLAKKAVVSETRLREVVLPATIMFDVLATMVPQDVMEMRLGEIPAVNSAATMLVDPLVHVVDTEAIVNVESDPSSKLIAAEDIVVETNDIVVVEMVPGK
jgi:hypothetical protein